MGNTHPVLAVEPHIGYHTTLVRVVGFAADPGREEPCYEGSLCFASAQAAPACGLVASTVGCLTILASERSSG